MVDLAGVHRVKAKGRTYVYAWRGGPRLKSPEGSAAFVRELEAAQAKVRGGDKGKLAGLVTEWLASDAWVKPPAEGGMAESTKANWRGWTDHIRRDLGKLSIKTFERPEVRQVIKKWRARWKDTPRAADMGKQVLSSLLSYAVEEGKLSTNPCAGLSNLYSVDRSEIIWTDADLEAFAKTASPEIMFALRLACLTGLRQGDLLKLTWAHVGDLSIEMPTGKSKGKLTYVVPLYAELRALLDEIKVCRAQRYAEIVGEAVKRGKPAPLIPDVHVLFTRDLKPWQGGFGSSWNKAMVAAYGEEWSLHFHDARGTAATRYHLSGFSNEEIAEIIGWSVRKVEGIIKRYVKRDALLRDRIRRMDGAGRDADG